MLRQGSLLSALAPPPPPSSVLLPLVSCPGLLWLLQGTWVERRSHLCSSSVALSDSCPGPRSLLDPQGPRVVRELAEPGSCGQPSPRPVADREASSGMWPACPPALSAHPRPQSPACRHLSCLPGGLPRAQCQHLATHLSVRQPTFFLEPPVCSSQDRRSGDLGSQRRSSRLEPASRWAWGCQLGVSAGHLT